jgi:hypothetical protein
MFKEFLSTLQIGDGVALKLPLTEQGEPQAHFRPSRKSVAFRSLLVNKEGAFWAWIN